MKGCDLYLHYYSHEDHVQIAKHVGKIKNKNWIVSYDNVPQIKEMYCGFRNIVYGLSYSAQDRYKGAKVMFFSDGLQIPEAVRPMHLAA